MKTLATLTLLALLSTGSAMATTTRTDLRNPIAQLDTELNKDPIGLIHQANGGKFKNDQSNVVIGIGNAAYNEAKINSVKLKKGILNSAQFNTAKVDSDQSNNVLGIGNASYNGLSANSIEMGCTTC